MKSFVPLIRGEWRILLFGFVLMFCSSPGQTYFIALFGGEIRHSLALSHGEFGAVYSLATLCSAVLLLWSGTLIDRVALPRIALGIVGGLAVAAIVMASSQNVVMLFLAVLLLRQFGQGLMGMTSSTAMMRYVSHSKGKANSLANMGYSTAEAIVPTLIIFLLLTINWRQTWMLVAAVLLMIVPIILLSLLRGHSNRHASYLSELAEQEQIDSESGDSPSSQRQWTRAEVIRDPLFYMFVPGLLSQSLLYTGFMFHQVHMVQEKGWALIVWGSLYFLFSITTIVMSLSIGALVDRVGAVRLAPFVTVPMAFGLLVLSSSNAWWVAGIFMFLMGCSTGAQAAITAPFFAERYGQKYFATIKSLASFVMVMMTAVSPFILGWFIDLGATIDALAASSAVYAFAATGLGYLAYRLSLR